MTRSASTSSTSTGRRAGPALTLDRATRVTRARPTAATELVEVVVGVVGRAHGIRGDVAVELRTDEPERRFVPARGCASRARRGC